MTRSSTAGWTFIEVLIVLVIISLLATIVIPRFSSTRDKALVATMQTDLRNLLAQEEIWKLDSGAYTKNLPSSVWSPSPGVSAPVITLTGDGWTASLGHVSSLRTCAIFVGSTSLAPASKEGVPGCTP